MITTVAVDGGLGLVAELPVGSVAYVDRDWLPRGAGMRVPAVIVDGSDGEPAAARALLDVAREAVAAVGGARPVEVQGGGAVAMLTASLLGVEPNRAVARPAAVADATGDPAAIAKAAARLADLGTLVLMGEPLGRDMRLNLYPDVHSRGLRVVGVRRPRVNGAAREGTDDAFLGRLPAATEATSGVRLEAKAAWYRVA